MNCEFSASMMCANYASLENEIKMLEAGGIDSYHLDIMDGEFVDNLGMGYQDMEFIRNATYKNLEAHLMANHPERYFDLLKQIGINVAYIHPESTNVPEIAIEALKKRGITPGIVINPGTSIESIKELLNMVDRVMVMCVVPGHAGSPFAAFVEDKIKDLLALRGKYGFELYLDGSCTKERILKYASKGVKGYVMGTSALFGHKESYGTILQDLRGAING
jgi:ribulose-phosphate 3-epimerase